MCINPKSRRDTVVAHSAVPSIDQAAAGCSTVTFASGSVFCLIRCAAVLELRQCMLTGPTVRSADRLDTSEFYQQTIFTSDRGEPRVKARPHVSAWPRRAATLQQDRSLAALTVLFPPNAGVAVLHKVQVQAGRSGGGWRPGHRGHTGESCGAQGTAEHVSATHTVQYRVQ